MNFKMILYHLLTKMTFSVWVLKQIVLKSWKRSLSKIYLTLIRTQIRNNTFDVEKRQLSLKNRSITASRDWLFCIITRVRFGSRYISNFDSNYSVPKAIRICLIKNGKVLFSINPYIYLYISSEMKY